MIPLPPQDCQECTTAVFPHDSIPDGNGGVLAFYQCPCGHIWSCGWRLDVLGNAA